MKHEQTGFSIRVRIVSQNGESYTFEEPLSVPPEDLDSFASIDSFDEILDKLKDHISDVLCESDGAGTIKINRLVINLKNILSCKLSVFETQYSHIKNRF